MSRLEQSKILDNLNLNRDYNDNNNEENKNSFFMRGSGERGGFRGSNNNGRGGMRYEQRGERDGNNRGGYKNSYGDNRGRQFGSGGYGGNRDGRRDGGFNRRDGGYGGNRGGGFFGRGGRDREGGFSGRGREGGFFGRGGRDREGGFSGRGRGGRGGYSGISRPYQDPFIDGKSNFYRDKPNNVEEDEEYQMQKESLFEKQKYINDFKNKYKGIIEAFKILFVNEQPTEEEIIQIIQNINSNPNLTIFEAMNLIYREIQIIKTLQFVNSGQKREYGPNKDILEQEYDQYYRKDNLKEVIQKYKIIENGTDNYITLVPERHWLFIDNSDKRRKLIKDEMGFFNYLPLLNKKENNDSDDCIYSKNDNEVFYHYLYYKTLMCKICDLSDENKLENDLCPYAHNILKDFRIIYDYKNEEVSKFMLLLLNSKLFIFQNYLNYIPMSLSPDFNLDTFKVHKCQLDKNCPNDYHICPYFHKSVDGDDQRRPPLLFGYSGSVGDLCFNEKKKKFCPKKCPLGIFCQFLHNKNEYNYHIDHFRKEYECKRKKIKGKCMYYKTCYGIHSDSSNDNSDEEEEEEDEKETEEQIENDKEIVENKNKLNTYFTIAKNFRCRECQSVCQNANLCYFIKCNHFLCIKCFKKIYTDYKKEKKKSKEEVLFKCPFCANKLMKDEIINISFTKK